MAEIYKELSLLTKGIVYHRMGAPRSREMKDGHSGGPNGKAKKRIGILALGGTPDQKFKSFMTHVKVSLLAGEGWHDPGNDGNGL